VSEGGEARNHTRFLHLTEDRAQQAIFRLAAVDQYLYDVMNGDDESDRDRPDPLPSLPMDHVREAQRQIRDALKYAQRTRRRCVGGELELVERKGLQA